MSAERRRVLRGCLLFVLVSVAGAAVRTIDHGRVEVAEAASWFTTDPDTLYHARRVERYLDEGHVAGTDDRLNHPVGSAIPWPPYYTGLLGRVLEPFEPEGVDPDERRAWIEHAVATAPAVFGALTSGVVALAAYSLAGLAAGVFAGLYHAFCEVGVAYGRIGNGDHHAWIALLWILVLFGLARAARDGLADRRRCARLGVVTGVLSGVALGSWVAALILIVIVDATLGLWIVGHARRPRPGLAALAVGYHVAALATALPAIVASPWRELEAFDVVNLSWFHAGYLVLALALVAPLAFVHTDAGRRRYPWVVLSVLALLSGILLATDPAAGRALREGFAWAGKANPFMARVGESRALFELGWVDGMRFVGYGALLFPLAWCWAVSAAWRGRWELAPYVVAGLVGAAQAGRQMRFADVLVPTLAVLVAGALAAAWARWELGAAASGRGGGAVRGSGRRIAPVAAAVLLALGSNADVVGRVRRRASEGAVSGAARERPAWLGARAACDFLRREVAGPGAVLASWRFGHLIEWVADRPSVATNFGLYVGEDGFRAPPELFMTEDPAVAERRLLERDVRFVLVTNELPGQLHSLIEIAVPDRFERYATFTGERGGRIEEPWFRTFGARLLFGGTVLHGPPAPPIDFLRLVYQYGRPVSTGVGEPRPAAQVWERVAGARLVGTGAPGETLAVEIVLRYAARLDPVVWRGVARTDASGRAELRVPYATRDPNGRGRVERARWTLADRSGTLAIGEADVLGGAEVGVD